MTALTAEELIAWLNYTSDGWRDLILAHPEALAIPCDIYNTSSLAAVLQHIVAVELRFAQRLSGIPESSYEQIPFASAQEIYASHTQAMELLQPLLANDDTFWEARIDLVTRSAGTFRVSRRTVLVHLLMHAIRHYAQLATIVRQHGIKPQWQMDYLMMDAQRL